MSDDASFLMKTLKRSFQFISLFMPLLLAATGALGIQASSTQGSGSVALASSSKTNESAQLVFMGIYMVMFAFTLFFYELLSLLPEIPWLSFQMRKNLGFMYGPVGRGAYTLMYVCLFVTYMLMSYNIFA